MDSHWMCCNVFCIWVYPMGIIHRWKSVYKIRCQPSLKHLHSYWWTPLEFNWAKQMFDSFDESVNMIMAGVGVCVWAEGAALRSCSVFWWSAFASMVTGSRSWLRQCVKAPVLWRPAVRGRVEPYVILHSVAETAGSRGTGRKSNSFSTVQPGYSWTTTSGSVGQPITDLRLVSSMSDTTYMEIFHLVIPA